MTGVRVSSEFTDLAGDTTDRVLGLSEELGACIIVVLRIGT